MDAAHLLHLLAVARRPEGVAVAPAGGRPGAALPDPAAAVRLAAVAFLAAEGEAVGEAR